MAALDPTLFERPLYDRKHTRLYHISNGRGLQATLCNYGARLLALEYKGVNVTPTYPSLDDYLSPTIAPYHGATVGRYANRIANGRFTLNGKTYQLPVNNGANHLHGGPHGFHTRVWYLLRSKAQEVTFSKFNKDGTEGYPGDMTITVTYTVTEADELMIKYTAETNAPTPFNITNHAFFNLNGEGSILDHTLQINADRYTPVDETLIPTGELRPVDGSAFDFRTAKRIGEHINDEEEQIRIGGGYDHNFVLNGDGNGMVRLAARAVGDLSGIAMEVHTDQPGVQLFSGNFEAVKGDPSTFRNTFCLETQHFPDSPNQPAFPNTILQPGDKFQSTTVHRFSKAE